MSKYTFIFTPENKEEWPRLRKELRTLQQTLMSFKGGLELTISEIKEDKSYKQLRGFHRLIDLLVPYFKDWTGELWNRDEVKDYIKRRNGYCKTMKGIDVVKSCKNATKEEMMGLIEEVIKFAAEVDIPNVLLDESEARDVNQFYSTN